MVEGTWPPTRFPWVRAERRATGPGTYRGRGAVTLLLDPAGRLLLQLRDDRPATPYRGTWGLFGGALEPGETSEAALRRELLEELAFVAGAVTVVGRFVTPTRKLLTLYRAAIDRPVEALTLREGAGLAYWRVDELPALPIAPHLRRVLDDCFAPSGTPRWPMAFRIAPLTAAEAEAIGAWRYDPPYDFYDWPNDPEDLAELLDPASWPGRYYAARDATGALVGFCQFARDGDTVEVGLGLHPALTGRGLGEAFVRAGLAFARQQFAPREFTLRVATFNRRAIRFYERVGFRAGRTIAQVTNGGVQVFLEMSRPA